jgi:hypothetical protein
LGSLCLRFWPIFWLVVWLLAPWDGTQRIGDADRSHDREAG